MAPIESIKNKVKKFINDAESITEEDIDLVERFKTKFTICEHAYKIIQSELKQEKINNIKLNVNSIKSNIHKMLYSIDDNTLLKLFGSEDARNNKSVKSLRNSLTHNIHKNDIEELKQRKDEIFAYMDNFINVLKTE